MEGSEPRLRAHPLHGGSPCCSCPVVTRICARLLLDWDTAEVKVQKGSTACGGWLPQKINLRMHKSTSQIETKDRQPASAPACMAPAAGRAQGRTHTCATLGAPCRRLWV
jgi:hypothetical protein